jgi:hypothetical protein
MTYSALRALYIVLYCIYYVKGCSEVATAGKLDYRLLNLSKFDTYICKTKEGCLMDALDFLLDNVTSAMGVPALPHGPSPAL